MLMKTLRLINLWCIIAIVMLGISACSDDDEQGASGTGIVSTWKYVQNDEYNEVLRFNSDGTFLLEENEYYQSSGEWSTRTSRGRYVYDEEYQELTMYYVDEDGDTYTETYDILQLTSEILVIDEWWGDDRAFTFYRQ